MSSTTAGFDEASRAHAASLDTWSEAMVGSVQSRDGTVIKYHRLGQGPGLVVLHGAMESAQSHSLLAEALADSFTVCVPDRREHTLGFPFAPDYSIQKEVEDLEALLSETASHSVFGVSSGGVICLKATLSLPGIDKAVVYEPPLSLPKVEVDAALKRYDSEMAEGRVAAALITAMKATQMGPRAMRAMPRWLLERMVNMQVRRQESQAKTGGANMRTMAGTLHYDFSVVAEMSGRLDEFRGVKADVLLLGGSESPAYLKAALDSLERILPRAKRTEFSGLDHGGSSDPSPFNKKGNPELVAREVRRYLVQS